MSGQTAGRFARCVNRNKGSRLRGNDAELSGDCPGISRLRRL